MTIADNLRMQHNSLAQGTKNAQDAISLLNIADGAITDFKDTLGMMKDRAMSAASDASSGQSRQALQEDIRNFMKSLNTIANNTTFNGLKLLNGTFSNKNFQVGAYANQSVGISLGSLNTNKIGHLTEDVSDNGVSAGTTAANLTINGATISQVTVSGTGKDGANLLAEAINAQEVNTGVTARATNEVSGAPVAGGAVADGDLSINGVSLGALNISANDSTGTLVDAINNISAQTGVTAAVEAGSVVLTAENGENIHITEANGGAAKAGLTAGTNYGKVTLSSNGSTTIENATAVSGLDSVTTTNYTLSDVDVTSYEGAQKALTILENALAEANQEGSNVGSVTNQLERVISVNQVTEQNVKAAESTIRDANIEEVTSQLNDFQIKYQASIFSLSKANELQQNVLSLLR
jgi:flagellin